MMTPDQRAYTHPDVLTVGVREGWADPETDPARIDWPSRQARAAIPFDVVDGRPVNPCEKTRVRHGRNELGHWGEAVAADALVTASDQDGHRWIVMVEREDGHGWALPGGHVDSGETPGAAAVRELAEETGLTIPGAAWRQYPPRYVPDPRGSDEAWMVTVLSQASLGACDRDQFPAVTGGDDATRAAWVRAGTYAELAGYLAATYHARVFAAHRSMLADALGPAAGTGIADRLTALADWIEERLNDEDYDRQAVAESGVTQLRELAALAEDATRALPVTRPQAGADARTAAAAVLRAVADLTESRPDIRQPSADVHYILSDRSTDIAGAVTAIALALSCQWQAKISRNSSGDWLELEATTGASSLDRTRVHISAKADAVCVEAGTKTVTTWQPQPGIAGLLGGRPVEEER